MSVRREEVRVDVRSLSRFVRMFDVAANIISRTDGAIRITFVVMLACPSRAASMYTVRVFCGPEAVAASTILDTVYGRDPENEQSDQDLIEQCVIDAWRAVFPEAKFIPRFPRVYFFFFDPIRYGALVNVDNDDDKVVIDETDYYPCSSTAGESAAASNGFVATCPTDEVMDFEDEHQDDFDDLLAEKELMAVMFDEDADKLKNATLGMIFREDDNDDGKEDVVVAPPTNEPIKESIKQPTLNFVDPVGYGEWLLSHKVSWLDAHHFVDCVLFDRSIFASMDCHREMMELSREWTLPLLRMLINRKVNDVLCCAISPTRKMTQLYTCVDYKDGLDLGLIRREYAVSNEQYRSRQGRNIVLPSEWIENKILPKKILDESIPFRVNPDPRFVFLSLIPTQQFNDTHFHKSVQPINQKVDRKKITAKSLFSKLLDFSPPIETNNDESQPLTSLHLPPVRQKRHFFVFKEKRYGFFDNPTKEDEQYGQKFIRFTSTRSGPPRRKQATSPHLFSSGGDDPETPNRSEPPRCEKPIVFKDWEQRLLIYWSKKFLDENHSISVNGDPGTGKSTVLFHLLKRYRRPLCAVPTNKMKFQMTLKLTTMSNVSPLASVCTVSACLKRLGCFKSAPKVYSTRISKRLSDALVYMKHVVSSDKSRIDHMLHNISRKTVAPKRKKGKKRNAKGVPKEEDEGGEPLEPARVTRFPDILMIDEVNMNHWQHIAYIQEGLKQLRSPVIMFGDSAQNRPIEATADNADLISINSSLVVQMRRNKRLIDNINDECPTPLSLILSDGVWNLNYFDENRLVNESVGAYIRSLIKEHYASSSVLDNTRIDLTDPVLRWCASLKRLHRYYLRYPCHRYGRSLDVVRRLAEKYVPSDPMLFLIAQTNLVCDRFNYWYAYTYYDQLLTGVFDGDQTNYLRYRNNYVFLYQRNSFIPYKSLVNISRDQLYTDDGDENGDGSIDLNAKIVRGAIRDDPWASIVVFCVGFYYQYLGRVPSLPPNSVLRLIQILYDEKTSQQYFCNDPACLTCTMMSQNFPKRTSFSSFTHDNRVTGLMMQNLEDQQFYIITPEYYTVNRYNSLWCSKEIDHDSEREGSLFYGYALRLHTSLTSYKVQGETLDLARYPSVHLDLSQMQRESVLVSMSRVTTNDQIKSILNVDECCATANVSSSRIRQRD